MQFGHETRNYDYGYYNYDECSIITPIGYITFINGGQLLGSRS
jgi:hypothetical protein